MEGRRCSEHGLALGADGRCVLCRRAAAGSASAGASGGLQGVVVFTAVALALGASGVAAKRYLFDRASDPVAAVAEPVPPAAPDTSAEEDEQPAVDSHVRLHPSGAPAVEPPRSAPASAPASGAPAPDSGEPSPRSPTKAGDADEKKHALRNAMHSVPITVYSAHGCAACKRTKAWLYNKGYNFTERDVDNPANRSAHRSLNPRGSVPTIDVDGQVTVGFSATNLDALIRSAAARRSL